ncbi:MAG: hypothetical protein ACRDZ4_08345 [Egibacteraceae bacterium]
MSYVLVPLRHGRRPGRFSGSRSIFEGKADVCSHRVTFWYDVGGMARTDELAETLAEEAEARAKACIIEGYHSGELNCPYDEREVRGWWEIGHD